MSSAPSDLSISLTLSRFLGPASPPLSQARTFRTTNRIYTTITRSFAIAGIGGASKRSLRANEEVGAKCGGTTRFRGNVTAGQAGEAQGCVYVYVCVRDANGVCTRASRIASLSTRGYGRKRRAKDVGAKRGSTRIAMARGGANERARERETEVWERGSGPRVNRICMETVCQWVASGYGYLTLFTPSPLPPLYPNPSSPPFPPLEQPPCCPPLLLCLILSLSFSPFLLRSISLSLSLPPALFLSLFLSISRPLYLTLLSRFNVAARKLLFLTGSIILPQPTR